MMQRLARSFAYCERVARRAASNFYPAFRLLPAKQRRAMCALYAFLRITDDLCDGPEGTADKQRALAQWRERFAHALDGRFSHRAHAALHHAVCEYGIPREYLEAVLDGVGMDLDTSSYATFADLYRYCYRVASAVGLACIHIWRFTDENAKSYAESAGIAFQLTNILRDLREDSARNRTYLPQEDLNRFGYSAESLRRGDCNESFRQLMRFQVERTRQYYAHSEGLADLLQTPGRSVFVVMSRTYRGLLRAIERRDYDVFTQRVSLPPWHKMWLAAQAIPVRCGWR